jgi:transcriptional regulator with XRE-family HTH domain
MFMRRLLRSADRGHYPEQRGSPGVGLSSLIARASCSDNRKEVAMKRVSPVDKHVGARLRMRRLMLDMTQTEIAKALGLTFQQVQKYEKGDNRVSASRLQHLCKILDVPVSFFFDGAPRTDGLPVPALAETDGEAAALNGFVATSNGLALVTAYTRIRDLGVRRAVVALVEQIAADPDRTMH